MHGNPLHNLILKSEAQDMAAELPFHKRPRDPHDIADVWVTLVKSGRAENVPVLHASLPYNNWPDNQLRSPLALAAWEGDRPMVNALFAVGADPLYRPERPGRPLESAWLELYCNLLISVKSLSLRENEIAKGMGLLLTNIGETGRIDQVERQHVLRCGYPPLVYQWIRYTTGNASLGAVLEVTDPLAHMPLYDWPTEVRALLALSKGPETGEIGALNAKY